MVTLRLSKLKRQRRRDPSPRQDAHAAQKIETPSDHPTTLPLAPAGADDAVATSGERRTDATEPTAAAPRGRNRSRPLTSPSMAPVVLASSSSDDVGPCDSFDGNGAGVAKIRALDGGLPTGTKGSARRSGRRSGRRLVGTAGTLLPSLSKIAGVDPEAYRKSARDVSTEIDSYILQDLHGRKRKANRRRDGRHVHHPIFGDVHLGFKSGTPADRHPPTALSFPPDHAAEDSAARSPYRRGDGVHLTQRSIALPNTVRDGAVAPRRTPCPSGALGRVRIVSEHGATVRRDFLIHDAEEAVGKLGMGAVREFVATRWLGPSVGRDDVDEGGGEGYDVEEGLVGVERYQVRLLAGDVVNKFVGDGMLGWISDRSRLKDDPYAIAEEVL